MLHVLGPEIFLGALGGAAAVDVVEHHALCEQAGEGLVDFHQAQVAHHFGPEARVQQVQDGVLDAADVLVHAAAARGVLRIAHPVTGAIGHHLLGVVRIAIAHEVPGRIDEGVHRVCFAPRGSAALGAGHARMEGFAFDQRVAAAIGHQVFG